MTRTRWSKATYSRCGGQTPEVLLPESPKDESPKQPPRPDDAAAPADEPPMAQPSFVPASSSDVCVFDQCMHDFALDAGPMLKPDTYVSPCAPPPPPALRAPARPPRAAVRSEEAAQQLDDFDPAATFALEQSVYDASRPLVRRKRPSFLEELPASHEWRRKAISKGRLFFCGR
jgi:hypothetical protein